MRFTLPLICLAVLTACQDSAPPAPVSGDGTDLQAVTAQSFHNMSDFSEKLARHLPIEIGMDRDTAEAEIRSHFGTSTSTGSVPIFQSKILADGDFEIVATRNGLADDSVKNEQLIARFSDDILTGYGMRVKCYRAPNPDKWTTKLCP